MGEYTIYNNLEFSWKVGLFITSSNLCLFTPRNFNGSCLDHEPYNTNIILIKNYKND
jgi:hypothetical protein